MPSLQEKNRLPDPYGPAIFFLALNGYLYATLGTRVDDSMTFGALQEKTEVEKSIKCCLNESKMSEM